MSGESWVVPCFIGFWSLLSAVDIAADPGKQRAVSSVTLSTGQGANDQSASEQAKVLAAVDGTYGHLEVLEMKGLKILVCDGVVQTAVPSSGVKLLPGLLVRARDYVGLIPYYRPRTRTALVIGLGGGLHAQALACHGITIHAVDIEPAVVPLAEEHFGFIGEVTISDGRAFLDRTQRRFDAIVLDTFQGSSVPKHLYTKEAFLRMRDRLTDSGVLAVHLVARPRHPATAAVARTLAAAFPRTVALQSGFGDGIQHICFLASRLPLDLQPEQQIQLDTWGFTGDEFFVPNTTGAPLLTDNRTCLEQLCRDLAAEHRRQSLKLLRK